MNPSESNVSSAAPRPLKCAVVTPVGPGHEDLYRACMESATRAVACSKGPFTDILALKVDDTEGKYGRSRARNVGVQDAVRQGADWIFFLDADDLMVDNAFALAADYVGRYDAIWGQIYSFVQGDREAVKRPGQVEATENIDDILNNDPALTLQMGHFVRASLALANPFDETLDTGEDFDYYLRVWRAGRCIKIPHPLFANREVTKSMLSPPANLACYDLSKAPASWDFVQWLVNAETIRRERGFDAPLRVAFKPGPKGGFRDDNLPGSVERRQQMLDCVLRPALKLVGAVEDSSAIAGCEYSYLTRPLSDASRAGVSVPKLRPSEKDLAVVRSMLGGRHPVVITLREASHWPDRNSNLDAWLKFAETISASGEYVIFIRDTEKAFEPLPFETCPQASLEVGIRAALYSLAKVNLMSSNGPGILLIYGDSPYIFFKQLAKDYVPGTAEWWKEKIGIQVGEQFPWANKYQTLAWCDDSYENIVSHYDAFVRAMTLSAARTSGCVTAAAMALLPDHAVVVDLVPETSDLGVLLNGTHTYLTIDQWVANSPEMVPAEPIWLAALAHLEQIADLRAYLQDAACHKLGIVMSYRPAAKGATETRLDQAGLMVAIHQSGYNVTAGLCVEDRLVLRLVPREVSSPREAAA